MNRAEVAFSGIAAQSRLLAGGEISSRELVDLYLRRIEELDPKLNAFSSVFAYRARAEADIADQRLARGESAPLLGVPVAVKDELDIAGEVATHGTRAYTEPAAHDCEHVRRLKEAGAIILGKTHLPELAIFGFTETEHHGATRNPWDLDRTPGGSSGGSGAAVAAGLIGGASASDGAGSIRIPAANCGLFGLKPQRGRISLMPESQHWYGMSKTGCLTRTVEDTALWLDVTHGPVEGDAHTPPRFEGSYVSATAEPPGSLRIAATTKPIMGLMPPVITDEVKGAVSSAGKLLEAMGHKVEESKPDYGMPANNIVALYAGGVAEHFESIPDKDSLEKRTKGFARIGRLMSSRIDAAVAGIEKTSRRVNALFDDCDVLMTPTVGEPAVPIGKWEGNGAWSILLGMSRTYPFTPLWNYTGQPAASIPIGLTGDGLPLAVQLIASPNREDLLLSLAAQLEEAVGWPDWRPPIS